MYCEDYRVHQQTMEGACVNHRTRNKPKSGSSKDAKSGKDAKDGGGKDGGTASVG